MRIRRVLAAASCAVVVPALAIGVPAAPAEAAPVCRPSISVLPLPPGAVSGAVTDAVPGTAVGTVTNARGITRATRWQRFGGRWLVRPIRGVAKLGSTVSSEATAVNRGGAITVNAPADLYRGSAYVAADGVLYPLIDADGGTTDYATDINDAGVVVGNTYNPRSAPARWDSWTERAVSLVPDLLFTSPVNAIDQAGDIVVTMELGPHSGSYAVRTNADGSQVILGAGPPPPGQRGRSTATDLNAAGRTVGGAYLMSGTHAVVWDASILTVLPFFAGRSADSASASATAVSESGVVVGAESDVVAPATPTVTHVLLYTDSGGVQSLLPASTRWTDPAKADAVDDAGTVYGASVAQAGGPMVPTAWTCAAAQAFTPTATGVPASTPKPDVVREAV